MQKTLIIILFFLQTALFASDLEILDDRKKYTFRLLVTADTAFQHSLQVHVTERQLLHICPVSDRPFFYRITLPDERYFYALFTRHTFPIELVMPYRTLSRLLDEVDLVVGETVGERGQKLSKETFAKHGLVMDDVVRRKFLDKEESYIQARPSFLATKPFEEELAEQSQWLESWYAQIPSHIRQDLENNPYLLIDKETLPQLHPALVIRRAEKDLDPAELDDRKRRAFGMDAMIEQAARSRDITYSGLESERDILDAGRFKELEEDIESYIDCAYPTPLRSLQEKVEKMSKSISNFSANGKSARPYWAKEETGLAGLIDYDYFQGKFSGFPLSETVIKRNRNWQPKILALALTQARPWLLTVGVAHAEVSPGLLCWFRRMNYKIERFSNRV